MVLGKITLEFTEHNGGNKVDADCDVICQGSSMKERISDHIWVVEQILRCMDFDSEVILVMLIKALKRNCWPDGWKMKCDYPGDEQAEILESIMQLPDELILELTDKIESKKETKNKGTEKGVN
jgi:hypothetical protein